VASSLLTGAAALLLILVGGYVIATGLLTIAESTMDTQIEMGVIQDSLRQSQMRIDSSTVGNSGSSWWLVVDLNNTGATTFGGTDFSRMDLFVYQDMGTKTLTRYTSSTGSPKFTYVLRNDIVNRNMWDPSETLEIQLNLTDNIIPNWTKVVASNGITASTNL